MQTREDLEEKRRQKEERDNNGPKDPLAPSQTLGRKLREWHLA